MKVAVWDTYVQREDKTGTMHFDILVPEELSDPKEIRSFGTEYLKGKPFKTGEITMDKCLFCHVERVPTHIEEEIKRYGYTIIELSNCE